MGVRRVAAALGLGVAMTAAAGSVADAQQGAMDRILELVGEARRSPCFLAPSRPPLGQAVGAELVAAASAGDGAAMQRVAEAYLADPARPRQALDWLERAALAGATSAAADAGSLHMAGRGTAQDEDAGAAWWRFGATRGDLRSMACLSAAHLLGRGVPQDLAEAARWAMLREARAPGRSLLRPAAADFERTLPVTTLAEARRLLAEIPEPAPPPPGVARAEGVSPDPIRLPGGALRVEQARPAPARPAGTEARVAGAVVVGQPGLILTSAQAVEGCAAMSVQAGLAQLGGVELHAIHRELDLALLTVAGLARAPLPVRAEVRPGEDILLPGRDPGHDEPLAMPGQVAAAGGPGPLQLSAPPGAAQGGAPVLDRRGHVVGIVVAPARGARPEAKIAVPPALVARFLDDHGVPRGEPRPDRAGHDLAQEAMRSVVELVCYRPLRAPQPAAGRASR